MIERFPLKTKFTIAMVISVIIMLFLGGLNILHTFNNIYKDSQLNRKIEFGRQIANVLHEMQKERGISSGFLTDYGHFDWNSLEQQRKKTDGAIQKLRAYYRDKKTPLYSPEIQKKICDRLGKLEAIRHTVIAGTKNLNQVLAQYTEINTFLLETIADIATEGSSTRINRNLMAYSHFLFLQEYLGLERAQGVILLAPGKKSAKMFARFSDLIALKREHKRLLIHYADPALKKVFLPIVKEADTQKILALEPLILYHGFKQDSSLLSPQHWVDLLSAGRSVDVAPKAWFDLLSRKMERLEGISRHAEDQIVHEITQELNRAQKWFVITIILVGLSLLVLALTAIFFLRLHKMERQQRTILDKYIIGSATDTRGVITEVSQAFCQISGYTEQELIGKNHNIVRHPDTPEETFVQLWETLKAGQPWQGKIKNRKKDGGYYWVYAHIEPLRDAAGRIDGYYAVRIDITKMEDMSIAMQEQEQEMHKQRELMEQQARLAQMGEMISMIAHQWRQPLSAIAAVAGSMHLKARVGKFDADAALDHANKIEELSRHMSETIDDFRNFFKPDQQETYTNFQTMTDNVLSLIGGTLQSKGIAVTVDTHTLRPLLTYENKVKQVLINLVKNAEDALLENEIENPRIHIEIRGAYFCIRDNAGGVPDAVMPRIFEPYFSTKEKKDGTGLGLYMSKIIIEEHCHGLLEVENSDEGAQFCITLPPAEEEAS